MATQVHSFRLDTERDKEINEMLCSIKTRGEKSYIIRSALRLYWEHIWTTSRLSPSFLTQIPQIEEVKLKTPVSIKTSIEDQNDVLSEDLDLKLDSLVNSLRRGI